MEKLFYTIILLIFISCASNPNFSERGYKKPDPGGNLKAYKSCLSTMNTSGYKQGSGCGDMFLFKDIEKGVLTVNSNLERLKLGDGCNELIAGKNIEVVLEVYYSDTKHSDSLRQSDYCNCIVFANNQKRYKLTALEGSVTIAVASGNFKGTKLPMVLARLTNLKFYDPIRKENIFIKEEVFWDVPIGWTAG